ncbi:MAG: hypothetical protein COA45_05340 [Zetaproteobacteria bacterium]|nr:MAG: hypothetical protein COA45_05340 [Zetaproteobacteria bacterium]
MGIIKPITLDQGEWAQEFGVRYRVIDDFLAVVDGRDDCLAAFKTARELIQNPKFHAVAVIRDSQTLASSFNDIAGTMAVDRAFGLSAKEGRVLVWPQKDRVLYEEASILYATKLKTAGFFGWGTESFLGTDFHNVFKDAREVFPEVLSWSIRDRNSDHVGTIHFDEANRPGLHDISNLPDKYIQDVNEEHYAALPGGITLSMALAHGGTIVCNSSGGPPKNNNFYDPENLITGYQAQDGDFLVIRSRGWGQDVPPAAHCAPKLDNALQHRYVAIASSHTSYLSPQVRESIGRSRLPSQDPIDVLLSEIDQIPTYLKKDAVLEYFRAVDPALLKEVMDASTVQRFPKSVRLEFDNILDVS